MSQKLWGGRFSKDLSHQVSQFSSSLAVDQRLWQADIKGSKVHAQRLLEVGILSPSELSTMLAGLGKVEALLSETFEFNLDAEDIHSELERLLREQIGPLAGKLHTGRSRNDQVVTATRIYLADELVVLDAQILALQKWILAQAEVHLETLLPGLTHFQHAQPVSLAHHLLAYFWMLQRDRERIADLGKRVRRLPLGSAALAGTPFPFDREKSALELGFFHSSENSLDAVSDRDFVIEFLSVASLISMHLSRWCEELVIWSAPEFGFIELDDSVTTGSSIMPQKKNPDVAELIRGRTGRSYGALMAALTMMKALPLSYNRDLQEDKLHLFTALDNVKDCTQLMLLMMKDAEFNSERMRAALTGDFSNATDLADELARLGLPFREAHEVVGKIVRSCLEKGATRRADSLGSGKVSGFGIEDLSLQELQQFSPLFTSAALELVQPEAVMKARRSLGGTSPEAVLVQIGKARAALS